MSSDKDVAFGGAFRLIKTLEISAGHKLSLPYQSPCNRWHGHNYLVEIEVVGTHLNEEGMLIDFSRIKGVVMALDHQDLLDVMKVDNPTAERIARWIAEGVEDVLEQYGAEGAYVSYVSVQENEGNEVIWER